MVNLPKAWWRGPVVVYLCMLAIVLLWNSIVPTLEIGVATGWIIYAVPLLAMFYFIRRVERRGFWRSTGVRKEGLVMGFVWVLGLMVIFSLISGVYETAAARALGFENAENVGRKVSEYFAGCPSWFFLYLLPASFIPVALGEELIFRGFVLERFLVRGPVFAIVASSAMHTSLHFWYAATGVGLVLFGSAFITSLWLGVAYFKTRNLIAPIAMHGLMDVVLPIQYFWGASPIYVISTVLTMASFACLFYLIFTHLRKLGKVVERAPPPPLPQRLEKSIERMRGMLEELKGRRARRELSEEEYARLSERYEARIRELEEELTRRKARPTRARA